MSEAPTRTLAARFAEAWINRTHRVCGRKLDPFCLHHVMMLDALRNPLADGTDPKARVTWGDLFQAVLVCTAPYEAEIKFPRFTLFWDMRLLWLALIHKACRRQGTLLQWHCAAFRNYQNDYESQPDLFFEESTIPLSAPGLLAKAVYLQRNLHMDERRVWTAPIGKMLFAYAATVEQVSDARMMEESESELMDLLGRIQRGEVDIPEHLKPVDDERASVSLADFGPEN